MERLLAFVRGALARRVLHMPFVYLSAGAVNTPSFTSSATPDTETDHWFLKPGVRNGILKSLLVGGKGAGLTQLSGIAYRLKKWFTTATAINTGTALTPAALDPGAPAAKATSATSTGAQFTAGTGGPTFQGGCTSGGASPGGWTAEDPDSAPTLEGSANQSFDLWVASGTASMKFEFNVKHAE